MEWFLIVARYFADKQQAIDELQAKQDAATQTLESYLEEQGAEDEAVSALLSLGYKAPQAAKVVSQVAKPGMTSEQLIREALKSMV